MRSNELLRHGIYISLLLLSQWGLVAAERLYEYRAEPLRLDSNQLYLWVDAPIIATTDFILKITRDGRERYSAQVGGVLGHVIISRTLSEDVAADLKGSENYEAQIYLESDQISDSLVIAVPGNLRQLWLDTLMTANPNMPVHYSYRYFDDMREVDIAAQLHQVDLLILPDIALADGKLLSDCPYILEWTLICEAIEDDLLATAVSYCLRGLFVDDGSSAYSTLVMPAHITSIFPRNLSHASELFAQSKRNKEKLSCEFSGFKMYPALTDRVNMALTNCNSGKCTFSDNQKQKLTLQFLTLATQQDAVSEPSPSWREAVFSARDLLDIKNNPGLDSCLSGTGADHDCRELVSRKLAESARFIPLGRSRLAVRKFEHVRYLDDQRSGTSLANFYTVRQ